MNDKTTHALPPWRMLSLIVSGRATRGLWCPVPTSPRQSVRDGGGQAGAPSNEPEGDHQLVAEVGPAQGHAHGHHTERAQGEADTGWGEERVGLWHRNSDRLATRPTTTEANPRGKRRVGSAKGALSEGECLAT